MSKPPEIVRRIKYEAWGSSHSGKPRHSPRWGNEVLPSDSHHIAINHDRLANLENLGSNPTLEGLAKKWSPAAITETEAWGCYGTSGSETNGKEALQLMAMLAAMASGETQVSGMYFIDTASHPMSTQLSLEAQMYAAASGKEPQEVLEMYLDLFKADPNYINGLLDALKKPEEDILKIRAGWSKQLPALNVPADAIILPDKEKYLRFCRIVGMENGIVEAIGEAFDFVKDRDDIPQTLGSLRCVIFTKVAAVLCQKLGLRVPITSVPFDELSIATGWGDLTLEQIQKFSRETFNDRVAFFNIFDPETGTEVPSYNRNNDIRLYNYTKFREIMKFGHFSGMGYYLSLMVKGVGPFTFVLDNYEASGPHQRLTKAETEGRFQSSVKMVPYPRGWVRIANFTDDENLTYGASPPLELLASELLKDPHGLDTLQKYIELLNGNIGKNTTIALDASAAGSTLWVVPDNRAFATAKRSADYPVNVLTVDFKNAQRAINTIRAIPTLRDNIQELLNLVVSNLSDIGIITEKLPSPSEYRNLLTRLGETKQLLNTITNDFMEKHKMPAKRYHLNCIKAIIQVLSEYWFFFDTEPNLLTGRNQNSNSFFDSLMSDPETTPENLATIADRLRKQAEAKIKSSKGSVIENGSPFHPFCQECTNAIKTLAEYQEMETARKLLLSLHRAASNNPQKLLDALNSGQEKPKDPFTANLCSDIAYLCNLGYREIINQITQTHDFACLTVQADQIDTQTKAAATKIAKELRLSIDGSGKLAKNEVENYLKDASFAHETINAVNGTPYEQELLLRLQQLPYQVTVKEIALACAEFCERKVAEIGNTVLTDRNKTLQWLEEHLRNRRLSWLRAEINERWNKLNHQDPETSNYLKKLEEHKRLKDHLIKTRNELQSKIQNLEQDIHSALQNVVPSLTSSVLLIQ